MAASRATRSCRTSRGPPRHRARRCDAGKIRRRLALRIHPQPHRLSRRHPSPRHHPRRLMPRHLFLIGLPGAGKTTTGRLVAARLDTHCTDIDPIIERATGMTIAELFEEEGEAAFRTREHLAVLQALGLPPHVVTPGGGWAVQPGNLAEVRDRALVIHLAVDPATGVGGRPLVGLATRRPAGSDQNASCPPSSTRSLARAPLATAAAKQRRTGPSGMSGSGCWGPPGLQCP